MIHATHKNLARREVQATCPSPGTPPRRQCSGECKLGKSGLSPGSLSGLHWTPLLREGTQPVYRSDEPTDRWINRGTTEGSGTERPEYLLGSSRQVGRTQRRCKGVDEHHVTKSRVFRGRLCTEHLGGETEWREAAQSSKTTRATPRLCPGDVFCQNDG